MKIIRLTCEMKYCVLLKVGLADMKIIRLICNWMKYVSRFIRSWEEHLQLQTVNERQG